MAGLEDVIVKAPRLILVQVPTQWQHEHHDEKVHVPTLFLEGSQVVDVQAPTQWQHEHHDEKLHVPTLIPEGS